MNGGAHEVSPAVEHQVTDPGGSTDQGMTHTWEHWRCKCGFQHLWHRDVPCTCCNPPHAVPLRTKGSKDCHLSLLPLSENKGRCPTCHLIVPVRLTGQVKIINHVAGQLRRYLRGRRIRAEIEPVREALGLMLPPGKRGGQGPDPLVGDCVHPDLMAS